MENLTPRRHDTKSPLNCCPRCNKAELLGRARRRPVFRYDKVEPADSPSRYEVFHGEHHVATVTRRRASKLAYRVLLAGDAGEELSAETLRDARAMAEETYTASWREGRPEPRGPVLEV